MLQPHSRVSTVLDYRIDLYPFHKPQYVYNVQTIYYIHLQLLEFLGGLSKNNSLFPKIPN